MKNSILSDFYCGNIIPADKRMVKGSEMARAVAEMSETAELLEHTLAPELHSILQRLTDAQLSVNDLTAEIYYTDGFRTGARFMLAIMDDTCENLEPITRQRRD